MDMLEYNKWCDNMFTELAKATGIPKKLMDDYIQIDEDKTTLSYNKGKQAIEVSMYYRKNAFSVVLQDLYMRFTASQFFNGNCKVLKLK